MPSPFRPRLFRRALSLFRRAGVAALPLALAGCASWLPDWGGGGPACPRVELATGADTVVTYRRNASEPSRPLYRAEILGFQGECRYHKDSVEVLLAVDLEISPGPAAGNETVQVPYFAALPAFWPHPQGKRVFYVPAQFVDDRVVRVRDGVVRLHIPLADPETEGPRQRVVLGLQMTPAQWQREFPETP